MTIFCVVEALSLPGGPKYIYSLQPSAKVIPYTECHMISVMVIPATQNKLLLAIHNSRPTTPGRDAIAAKLIQGLSLENTDNLLAFYNDCFDSDAVPPSWKEGTIVSICKPGKPTRLTSSYRSVSLTAACFKVLQRILLHRLIS